MSSAYTDAELDALRETVESDEFYAQREHRRAPGIARLVRRLDAAEEALDAILDRAAPLSDHEQALVDAWWRRRND